MSVGERRPSLLPSFPPPLCILCFKNRNEISGNESSCGGDDKMEYELLRNFFRILEKHFERKTGTFSSNLRKLRMTEKCPFIYVVPNMKVGTCMECCKIISAFCDAYHKMKCLELELDFKLDQLKNFMKLGERRSERISCFRDWCLIERLDMDEWMGMREQFEKQCELSKTDFPKITLHRVETSGKTSVERNRLDLNDCSSPLSNQPSEIVIVSTSSVAQENPVTIPTSPVDLGPVDEQCARIDQRNIELSPSSSPMHEDPEWTSDLEPEPNESALLLNKVIEPPSKKRKFSSSQPQPRTDNYEKDNSIIKQSPAKQLDNFSPRNRKVRNLLTCKTCKATFSTSERLDEHVTSVHSGTTTNISLEVLDTDACDIINEVVEDDGDDWVMEPGDISNDDGDGMMEPGDISDDNNDGVAARPVPDLCVDKDVTEKQQEIQNKEQKQKAKKLKPSQRTKLRKERNKNLSRPRRKKKGSCKCLKCKKPRPRFSTLSHLQTHQNYLHTNGYYTLSFCDIYESSLRLDVKKLKLLGVDVNGNHCCNKCGKTYLLAEELANHEKYHLEEELENCENALILAQREIRKKKVDPENGLSCGKCDYSTFLERELINHYLVVHMNKPAHQAICPICLEVFKYVDEVPLTHYVNAHDLTRLEDTTSTGISCVQDGCSAYFLTEDQLQKHWNIMHADKCEIETKALKHSESRKKSARKRRNRPCDLLCEYCSLKFRFQRELNNHLWSNHADEKLGQDSGKLQLTEDGLTIDDFVRETNSVCEKCKAIFVFGNKEQMERHGKHHGEFQCNFCDVVKTLASELASHEAIHNIGETDKNSLHSKLGRKFKCPRCSFTSQKRKDYIHHHVETHLGLPSDKKRCPICWKHVPFFKGSVSSQRRQLKKWMIDHFMENHDKTKLDPGKMPKCDKCPGYFHTIFQLQCHMKEVHKAENFMCTCEDCGKVFTRRDKLKDHRIRMHKLDQAQFQLECSFPECCHRFETHLDLELHETRAHFGANKESGVEICTECGKKCCGKVQMLSHMKSHTKKEPKKPISHFCEECGKTFSTKHSLKTHITCKHVGPEGWEFQCEVCSKKCLNSAKLAEHMRIHTKDKPFLCEFCDSMYAHAHNLRIHMKNKHADVMSTNFAGEGSV